MRKILLGLFLLIVLVSIGLVLNRNYTISSQEKQIFCEKLEPGMEMNEVTQILRSSGGIDTKGSPIGPVVNVYITFPSGHDLENITYVLPFTDDQLTGIGKIANLDAPESVCLP